MRAIIVILGLALATAAPVAAQQQWKLLEHSHGAAPALKVDFGLKRALAIVALSQLRVPMRPLTHELLTVTPAPPLTAPPVDCAMVKTHKHALLTPATPVVTPPAHPKHHLKVVTVPGCPGR